MKNLLLLLLLMPLVACKTTQHRGQTYHTQWTLIQFGTKTTCLYGVLDKYRILSTKTFWSEENCKNSKEFKRVNRNLIAERNKAINKLPTKFREDARKGLIRVGMSEAALLLSWGKAEKINRSVYSFGVHKQHIYGETYIYTKNGFITSWQD